MEASKLPRKALRLSGTLGVIVLTSLVFMGGCATLPKIEHKRYTFPKRRAFIGKPKRAFEVIGVVRSKINFPTLDPTQDEQRLCNNYFNKAARQLIKYATKKGADAVVDVKSVVFLYDGRREEYPQAECADTGAEGQILAMGYAVRWKKAKSKKTD